MLQRIQTVYLFLGVIFLAAFFGFPTVWNVWVEPVHELLPWGLVLWGAVTACLGLGSIFLYHDRERQRRVVVNVQWMTIIFAGALYSLLVAVNRWTLVLRGDVSLQYTIAILLPVAAYVMFYLARRGIERDIEKIRSVDRLR
jgi:hypothetical protein